LIEGAHQGAGLGHQFLRHVERTRLLVHLLDGASTDPLADFEQINEELAQYNPELAKKSQIIVLNKRDLPSAHNYWPAVQAKAKALNSPAMFVSAVTQSGVQELMRLVADKLASIPKAKPMDIPEIPVFTLEEETEVFTVNKDADGYHVSGQSIERLVAQTYWDIDEAMLAQIPVIGVKGEGIDGVIIDCKWIFSKTKKHFFIKK